jgi:alpha-ribazole phosphatase
MTETTRWWLVRHAPAVNPAGLILGRTDIDAELSDTARLRALAAYLPRAAFRITTSLRRAGDTARWLAVDAPVRVDDRFREQDFGRWEGRRWDDIAAAESAAYWRDPAGCRAPGGESFADVVGRVAAGMADLNDACDARDIVVVAHAGSIRAALVRALGCAPAAGLAFEIAPLSLTRLDAIRRDKAVWWRVCGVNLAVEAP